METLLERAVRVAHEAGLRPVVGVVPADLALVPQLKMICVLNAEARDGMASSIRVGLRALAEDDATISGAILLACDQPSVTAAHLRELASDPTSAVASSYAGRNGVPAYFPARTFQALMALEGDVGARDLIQNARSIPLENGDLDIDTVDDLIKARRLYET